uniref:Exocyst subunit Exo70 family protein n=1 Tax=Salix viminalis TaxID=40686 RepID=A0A6N2N0F3_SALVM
MTMGEYDAEVPELEGEENLIAAAKQIVRALGSKKNLTDDAKKILAELGTQLTTMTSICENEVDDEGRLNVIQEKIMSWETDQSMHWDFGPDEANDYINSADELRKLIEKLEAMCLKDDGEKELLRRAHDVLQTAMARLEEEFKHVLIQNRQPFEPEHMSFRSSEDDAGSMISLGDESFEESQPRDSSSRNSEEYIVDLVHPVTIPELRCIANLMFISGYGHECSQAYVSVRRDALDEFLLILEMEKLSIEDVLKLEWGSLNSKIRRWVRTMKIFVRVYLASEKCLFEQIFGDLGTANLVSFTEASKASMLRLLNFGEAVSIGPHKPEKLFPILDMYEVLADLLPDIDSLYADEAGARVRIDCREVLRRFGDSVRAAFLEFENAISTSTSTNPIAGGGIHPLTRFVMVYLDVLTGYRETLNSLLKDHDGEDAMPLSPDITSPTEEENTREGACDGSPLALHFISVASILECNLDDKARLYRDASLQHIFLMNNIHYMAQKVANSNLQWVDSKHNWKFQQHEINYERTTWSSILAILKVEGDSSSIRTLLKESFRNFHIAFEKVYRTQTAWLIPNAHLREDLRISTSLKVIQAYRTFVGRYAKLISVKQYQHLSCRTPPLHGRMEFTINLVRHDVIPELRRIANVMSISGYADECCVAYIGIQSSALVENLRILEKEKLRTEDVLKLEQVSLKSNINRRIQTMKMFLRVYLASDKWLSEQIFEELGTVNLASFTEPLVVQLLKYFDKAISTGPKNPGKVFHLLDMYEVLAGLLPYLDSLYSDNAISQVIVDGDMVLRGLADSARKTLDEFEGSIMTYRMSETFAAEGIHPLTKNCSHRLQILDSLLNDHCGEHPMPASSCTSSGVEEGNISGGTCDFSPIARHFLSNNSILKWLSNGSSASPSTKEESISRGTCKLSPMALQFRAFCCILEFQLLQQGQVI